MRIFISFLKSRLSIHRKVRVIENGSLNTLFSLKRSAAGASDSYVQKKEKGVGVIYDSSPSHLPQVGRSLRFWCVKFG
jgi:hypothetical protein